MNSMKGSVASRSRTGGDDSRKHAEDMELKFIKDRQKAGIEAAKSKLEAACK